MSDPIDRPTTTIDATRPVADQIDVAPAPAQAMQSLTTGLLQALGAELVSQPRPEPIDLSHLRTDPFPTPPSRHHFNSGSSGLHFGQNHGRLQIDLSVFDVEKLAGYHAEVDRRREALQERPTGPGPRASGSASRRTECAS